MPKDRVTEMLPVTLTPDEYRDRASRLARYNAQADMLKGQMKESAAGFKAEITKCETHIADLSRTLNNNYEMRTVDCIVLFNFPNQGMKTIRRGDTLETVRTASMDTSEMQRDLPLEPAKSAENVEVFLGGERREFPEGETGQREAVIRDTDRAWPVADEDGVFHGEPSEVLAFKHKSAEAHIALLQFGPSEWISAVGTDYKTGQQLGIQQPLTASVAGHHSSRGKALLEAASTIIRHCMEDVIPVEGAPASQKDAAKKMGIWAQALVDEQAHKESLAALIETLEYLDA